MSKPYSLRYLPIFWEDLNRATSYIAFNLNNPAAAMRLVDSIEAGIFDHMAHDLLHNVTPPREAARHRP